jgi:hypothetical protein
LKSTTLHRWHSPHRARLPGVYMIAMETHAIIDFYNGSLTLLVLPVVLLVSLNTFSALIMILFEGIRSPKDPLYQL